MAFDTWYFRYRHNCLFYTKYFIKQNELQETVTNITITLIEGGGGGGGVIRD